MSKRNPLHVCAEHPGYKPHRGTPVHVACVTCWAARGRWQAFHEGRRGTAKGGGRSSKAKGRVAVVAVVEKLLAAAPWLAPEDIFVKATSQTGVDIHLSPRALDWFSFSPEVKNAELLNIWKALQQAQANATPGRPGILIFKRAHSELYIALRADDFLRLLPCPPSEHRRPSPRLQPTSPESVGPTDLPPSSS